jgi:hypothetical protein
MNLLNPFWYSTIISPINNLPKKSAISTMDWAYNGESFVQVPSMDSVDMNGLDYAFLSQPFFGNRESNKINKAKVCGMDWCYAGSPYVQIASKEIIHLNKLDYGFKGETFYGEE